MLSFLSWYLLLSLLGLLAFPLAFRLFPKLADRGYTLARTLGLLVWGYIFWLLTSLGVTRNTQPGLALAILLLGGIGIWALARNDHGPQTAERCSSSVVGGLSSIVDWLKANRRLVITTEVVFLLSFAFMAFVRACNPETVGTEKPMELAFMNAILRSPTFPPRDPWLSGYAISYYYFGYVITAMLARLTGVSGGVAFNLMLALVFALAAVGAYGLLYNLLALQETRRSAPSAEKLIDTSSPSPAARHPLGLPLLGPFFLLIVSNIEGFLDILHHRGVFWKFGPGDAASSSFWNWLAMENLQDPPARLGGLWERLSFWWQSDSWAGVNRWFAEQFVPARHWWWWRASRVIQDLNLAGAPLGEVIDEFPFFSFLLGDLHPHVLAIPFDLLVVALALNLFLGGWKARPGEWRWKVDPRLWAWLGAGVAAAGLASFGVFLVRLADLVQERRLGAPFQPEMALGSATSLLFALLCAWIAWLAWNNGACLPVLGLAAFTRRGLAPQALDLPLYVRREGLLVAGLVLGGLAFLNVWDALFVVAVLCGGHLLGRVFQEGWSRARLGELAAFLLPVGLLAVVLYLPWFAGFSSQAGGVLPNLVAPTRGAQLWVMFASLLLPVFAWLAFLGAGQGRAARWFGGFALAAALAALLWGLSWLLGLLINVARPDLAAAFLEQNGAAGLGDLFRMAFVRRLFHDNGGWITLLLLIGPTLAFFLKTGKSSPSAESSPSSSVLGPSSFFVLFLILIGALVVLGPEYLYLRDQFGGRMNTVFKFYYQGWIVWSLAAAFGTALLLRGLRRAWRLFFLLGLAALLCAALTYPALGLLDRTDNFDPAFGPTLDGAAHLDYESPSDAAAIRWMQSAPDGILAEAASPGSSYTYYARYATYTGLPAVLGWPGHEGQWRGGYVEQGTRLDDLQRLYTTTSWDEARQVIDQYAIRYVVVGPLERQTYRVEEGKFERFLFLVYQNAEVRIYEVP